MLAFGWTKDINILRRRTKWLAVTCAILAASSVAQAIYLFRS